jgi:ABC-2 type transport system permease protein
MCTFQVTLSIFYAAVRKEIVQLVRTKRFLVVMAVFLLFGLGSPMLIKITPELIKGEPGGEELVKLLPPPTPAEAVGSYVDTMGSFAYLVAILLGMSAVAGEKESGTAGLILSKPIPRWAFILSKFSAQLLVYTLAFLVSGLAAYYCTTVLFGAVDLSVLLQVTLLLLLCLSTCVGVTLLASVLTRTVAAAGGVGLGLYALVGLARNIPHYGKWTPNGLTVWARELGVGAENVAANPGAIVGTLVLILVCLITSVALFERQEIQ